MRYAIVLSLLLPSAVPGTSRCREGAPDRERWLHKSPGNTGRKEGMREGGKELGVRNVGEKGGRKEKRGGKKGRVRRRREQGGRGSKEEGGKKEKEEEKREEEKEGKRREADGGEGRRE